MPTWKLRAARSRAAWSSRVGDRPGGIKRRQKCGIGGRSSSNASTASQAHINLTLEACRRFQRRTMQDTLSPLLQTRGAAVEANIRRHQLSRQDGPVSQGQRRGVETPTQLEALAENLRLICVWLILHRFLPAWHVSAVRQGAAAHRVLVVPLIWSRNVGCRSPVVWSLHY